MPFLKRHGGLTSLAMLCLDALCVLAACAIAVWLTLDETSRHTFLPVFVAHLGYVVGFVLVWMGSATEQHLFISRRGDNLFSYIFSVFKAVAWAVILSGFIVGFVTRQGIEREFLVYFGIWSLLFILAFRTSTRLLVWSIRRHGYNFRQVLMIGANERSRHLVELIIHQGKYGYHLAGVLEDEPSRLQRYLSPYEARHLGHFSDLEKVLVSEIVDEVYLCLPVRSYYEQIMSMAHLCEGIGVPVRLIADLFPLRLSTSRVMQLGDIPLLSLSPIPEAQIQLLVKRVIDFAGSLVLLILFAPLFLIVSTLIKLESPGPIFFKQERVGRNGRRFRMIKFRSMVQNAEALRRELEAHNEADGPVFKMRNDPRMTRIGRWIRKYSIDELPQLFNVLLGDMSLVGPRPPIPAEVEKYSWDQRRRLCVKPGMTGLWQVSGRNDVSFHEWVEMDLTYIDSWSLMQDVRILLRTVNAVIQGRGAA